MTSLAARYWREITVILMVKLVVLFAIHETWFDQPVSRQERTRHLESNIYGATQAHAELPEVYDK